MRGLLAIGLCAALAGCATDGGDFRSAAGSSGAAPWTAVPAVEPETLRFAIIGDRTGLARPGVFEQAVRQVGWMKPELVINVGDLLEGYTGDEAALTAEWEHIEGAVRQLDVPFFYVPGNHDLSNEVMLRMWRERRGEPYYAFEYKDVLFLILDTEDPPMPMPEQTARQFRSILPAMAADPAGTEKMIHAQLAKTNEGRKTDTGGLNSARFSQAQVEFVRRALAEHGDVRWTFVLMHKPAWTLNSAEFSQIEAMLADRPYAVIAGHNHYYRHETRNGRDYIQMGTVGGISHEEGPGKMDHIAWVTVDDSGPRYAVIKLTGLLDKQGESGQTLAR